MGFFSFSRSVASKITQKEDFENVKMGKQGIFREGYFLRKINMTRICLIDCDTLEEGETHRDYLTLKLLFISPCCPPPKLAKGLYPFINVLSREKNSTT